MVSYWFAILSSSILNKSARSSAIEPAPPPPPPPPAWRPVCTCSSNSSSACCRNCSARFSGGSAPSGFWPCSCCSASVICSAAFGNSSAIFLNEGSDTTRRLFMRSTRPFTWSRNLLCARVSTTMSARNLSAFSVLRSRWILNVPEMIWRCCCDSAPTSWPPPPPPPPPPPDIEVAGLKFLSKGRMRRKKMSLVACLAPATASLSVARAK